MRKRIILGEYKFELKGKRRIKVGKGRKLRKSCAKEGAKQKTEKLKKKKVTRSEFYLVAYKTLSN